VRLTSLTGNKSSTHTGQRSKIQGRSLEGGYQKKREMATQLDKTWLVKALDRDGVSRRGRLVGGEGKKSRTGKGGREISQKQER